MSTRRIVEETATGPFDCVLGKNICIFCGVYIYTGILVCVNDHYLELDNPQLVYETGELNSGEWKDAQVLPSPWRVMIQGIESWGPAKC